MFKKSRARYTINFYLRLKPEEYKRLDRIGRGKGLTRTTLVRELINLPERVIDLYIDGKYNKYDKEELHKYVDQLEEKVKERNSKD